MKHPTLREAAARLRVRQSPYPYGKPRCARLRDGNRQDEGWSHQDTKTQRVFEDLHKSLNKYKVVAVTSVRLHNMR
ncbi:hypothetical protein [Fischerella sp. PCC 9605]|uniref:hypothetical protein n=1 Tax=Fischerella sp. PCC 9605 TaxID=1173024 RepID=UPI0018CC0B54|nr:hypothetical protein [Fischerella sp. PCC 9605]